MPKSTCIISVNYKPDTSASLFIHYYAPVAKPGFTRWRCPSFYLFVHLFLCSSVANA